MSTPTNNMTFDVNLLPLTDGDHNLGSSDYKWNLYVNQINGATSGLNSYGKITPANSTGTSALSGNTTAVEAITSHENLKISAGNKWVVLAGTNSTTAGSDELKIAHFVPSSSITNSGPSSAQTPSYDATFNIPVISLDAAGHVTGISTTTVKIPASDNTDEKVKQTSSTASAAYKILLTTTGSPSSGTAYNSYYGSNFTYNPNSQTLSNGAATLVSKPSTTANTAAYDVLTLGNNVNITSSSAHSEGKIKLFSASTNGHVLVGASTSTEYTSTLPNVTGLLVTLDGTPSSNVGSTTQPVYVTSAGKVSTCNTYAGGTAVTLNGTSKAATTASFYAPTSAGTANQILYWDGTNSAPAWTAYASAQIIRW